jgi:hypothetical protein
MGTGWKGVRRWCRETWQRDGSSLDKILSGDTGPPLDLLVIQVDADIADEADLQTDDQSPVPDVRRPCPPIAGTAIQLRRVIARWLQHDDFPAQVVLAIPSQDTENWTFAALFPDDNLCTRDDYECIKSGHSRPGYYLTLKKYGKILNRSGGEIKKPLQHYRKVAPQVAARWSTVCSICSQAQQFTLDVQDSVDPGQNKIRGYRVR